MKYINANSVLPEKVIKTIQEYIDGECLYIPRKEGRQKAWGEKSGARANLRKRNREIFIKYGNGSNVKSLTQKYFLSEQSIRRIISQEKKQLSNSIHNHL